MEGLGFVVRFCLYMCIYMYVYVCIAYIYIYKLQCNLMNCIRKVRFLCSHHTASMLTNSHKCNQRRSSFTEKISLEKKQNSLLLPPFLLSSYIPKRKTEAMSVAWRRKKLGPNLSLHTSSYA